MSDADNASMSTAVVPQQYEWTHVALVVDRDNNEGCSIYLNGEKQPLSSVRMASSADDEYDMDTGFMFGRDLNGLMDELAVYAKALTEEEVKAMVGRHSGPAYQAQPRR